MPLIDGIIMAVILVSASAGASMMVFGNLNWSTLHGNKTALVIELLVVGISNTIAFFRGREEIFARFFPAPPNDTIA
jgi:hypothetical protein